MDPTPRTFDLNGPAEAPVVTLLHALGSDRHAWTPQTAALSDRWRVLACDLRGHGNHDTAADTCSLDDLAGDVLALWDRLKIARSHVVGLSLGGCVGVALAARAGSRLGSLTVVNARLEMDEGARDMWLQRSRLAREPAGLSPLVEPTLSRWFTPAFMHDHPAEVDATRRCFVATSPKGYAICAQALSGSHLRGRLAALRCPTLLIAGLDDQAVPADLTRGYAQALPHVEFLSLPGPHLLPIEQPASFNRALRAFLERADAGTA